MAILTIFCNNIRTVSRNWIYFVILIICPIILIAISGIMLNSADFNNIKVGLVDDNPNYEINKSSFNNLREFVSLDNCIEAISLSEISICVHSFESEERYNIDVYVDNRRKVVEYYSRQFVLERFSAEQFYFYEQSSKEIEDSLTFFSLYLNNSEEELYNAYFELEQQEKELQDYQKKLAQTKNNLNNISKELKEVQPQIKRLKEDLNSETNSLSGNLTLIKEQRTAIENNIGILKTYLSTRLTTVDYNYVIGILDDSMNNLNQIEDSLEAINSTYSDPDFIRAINNLDEAIEQMDMLIKTLDEIESDLKEATENTKKSKERMSSLIQDLNEGKLEIEDLSKKLDEKQVYTDFKESFLFSNDPIFVSFPLLISIIITFTSIVLSNMLILKQTGQKSYFRESLTPTGNFSFFFATYLTNLFFIFIQILALFGIGYYLFGSTIFLNIQFSALAIILTVSIFIFIGMTLGYVFKTPSLSMLIAIFTVIIFFVFSDILAPTALTGKIVKIFVNLNPFVLINTIVFDILLIRSELNVLYESMFKLSIMCVIGFFMGWIAKVINKKRLIQD